MSYSNLFDEHDIAELDDLLTQIREYDGMRLDAVQGLLAAICVSPRDVEELDWLPIIVGRAEEASEFEAQLPRLYQLLRHLRSAVEYGVEHFAFDPIFSESRDEQGETHVDAGGWCEGFSMGVDLLAEVWEAQMQHDDQLIGILSPIVALGVDDGVFSEIKDHHIAPLSEAEREELMQRLPQVLAEVRQYWDENELAPPALKARQLH
jgi:uncharacterized protein